MMRIIDKFARHVSRTRVFALLSIIIVVYLISMSFYINDNRHARRAADRDVMIQKIINVINLLEATPIERRAKAISAMHDPDIKLLFQVHLNLQCNFETFHFGKLTLCFLRKQLGKFAVSILLTKDQWLNINATLYTHFLLRYKN